MNQDQIRWIKIRDCFYAGYSMPQYCIDNGIKKPLIASYDPQILWELYVQFRYDKRIQPKFCILEGENQVLQYSVACVLGGARFEKIKFSEISNYDKLLILTLNRFQEFPKEKVIYIDTILNRMIRFVYAERPLYNYINYHRGVKVIVINAPWQKMNEYSTEYEKVIAKKSVHKLRMELKNKKENKEQIPTRFDRFGYSNDDVYAILSLSDARTRHDGTSELIDNAHPLVMIQNGKRQTAYQRAAYRNTIWFMGTCTYFGIGVPYDKTIESYLQKILNESGHEYRVENASQFYAGRYQDIFYNLEQLPVTQGDIIFICLQNLKAADIPFLDTSNLFVRPHNYGEVFSDSGHLNETGYKIVAEKIFNYLISNDFFKKYIYHIPDTFPPVHQYGIIHQKSNKNDIFSPYRKELDIYKENLVKIRAHIGSIVMNCNPFTLGHRYLIDYAAERVERLYIFVVEEDKSIFPFKNRLELVKKGTSDLKNVTVLPSGKFIISSLTFSGYFNKAELQDSVIDTSMDVEMFAKEIAPQLGIDIRFAGEEPLDNVTRQYNEAMSKILPQYGITFEVIPRRKVDGKVISASRVRKLLEQNNFNEIKKLVPETTLCYLKKLANNSNENNFSKKICNNILNKFLKIFK